MKDKTTPTDDAIEADATVPARKKPWAKPTLHKISIGDTENNFASFGGADNVFYAATTGS